MNPLDPVVKPQAIKEPGFTKNCHAATRSQHPDPETRTYSHHSIKTCDEFSVSKYPFLTGLNECYKIFHHLKIHLLFDLNC